MLHDKTLLEIQGLGDYHCGVRSDPCFNCDVHHSEVSILNKIT